MPPAVPARRRSRRLALAILLLGLSASAGGCKGFSLPLKPEWNRGPGINHGADPYARAADLGRFEGLA